MELFVSYIAKRTTVSNDMASDIIDAIENPPVCNSSYERKKVQILKEHCEEELRLAKDMLAQTQHAANTKNIWYDFNFDQSGKRKSVIRNMRDKLAAAYSIKKLIDEGDTRIKTRAEEVKCLKGSSRLLYDELQNILINWNQATEEEKNSQWSEKAADLLKAWRAADIVQESAKRERDDWDKTRGELLARMKSLREQTLKHRMEYDTERWKLMAENRKTRAWKDSLAKRAEKIKKRHRKERIYHGIDTNASTTQFNDDSSSGDETVSDECSYE